MQEPGATGAAFASEAQLGHATAVWPATCLGEVCNSFAGVLPLADIQEVMRFTDRKTTATRIWTAAQRLGESLEAEMNIAQQDRLSFTRAADPAKIDHQACFWIGVDHRDATPLTPSEARDEVRHRTANEKSGHHTLCQPRAAPKTKAINI
jgi:hypothetical protein